MQSCCHLASEHETNTATGEVCITCYKGAFTHTLRCAGIVLRCAIATLSLAQRTAATTISTILAQGSVYVNVP